MPHRIIRCCIVRPMKPHELIKTLVEKSGGSSAAARAMGDQKFQGTLHKFISGNVPAPARKTAARIADHYDIDVEAIYVERIATLEAIRLGLISSPPLQFVERIDSPQKGEQPALEGGGNTKLLQHETLPPLLKMEEVMDARDLPDEFRLKAIDDALAPRLRAGQVFTVNKRLAPITADGVLIQDKEGGLHMRVYRQGVGRWEGVPVNEAYPTLDSARDGLVVLAVLTSVDARWS